MSWFHTQRWSIVTVVVIAALVAPVALDRDSYPLSTYPMYARVRPAEVDLPTAVGVDASGGTHRLSLALIGASDDPLIVAGALREAIARGAAGDRCDEIAQRVADDPPASDERLVAIEVTIERRDIVAFVRDEASLVDRTVEARCPVSDRP